MGNPFDEIKRQGGLWTHGNPLNAPDGAMLVADEAEILREDMVTRRRGYTGMSSNLPAFRPEQLISIGGQLYLSLDSGLWYWDGTNWLRKQTALNVAGSLSAIALVGTKLYAANDTTIIAFDLVSGGAQVVAGRPNVSAQTDGVGDAARFSNILGMAWDGADTIYVADNPMIRKLTISTSTVSFVAGAATNGAVDGAGSTARFGFFSSNNPDLLVYAFGNLYVCDPNNFAVRRVTPAGVVSTFAGLMGSAGTTDGTGAAARFAGPLSMTLFQGSLLLSDINKIRSITVPGAVVLTLPPASLALRAKSADANFVYGTLANNLVRYDGVSTTTFIAGNGTSDGVPIDGIGAAAHFSRLGQTIVDASGNLIALDRSSTPVIFSVRKIYLPQGYAFTWSTGQINQPISPSSFDGVVLGPT